MVYKSDIIAETGLQFFGKVSVSISHEIKNVLAIINENAGLLEDLSFMADRGKSIDPARLKTMAEAIKRQIGRADDIMKNMGRFAHSIDQIITTVDLNETIELMIALTDRFTAMKNVQVDLHLPENPATFQTAPYFLMNLLWLCLNFSMSACGNEKRIELLAEAAEADIRIRFRRLAGIKEVMSETFPSDREKDLLDLLAADLSIEPEDEEIVLRLSKSLDIESNGHDST